MRVSLNNLKYNNTTQKSNFFLNSFKSSGVSKMHSDTDIYIENSQTADDIKKLTKYGIEVEEQDGFLYLSHYSQPNRKKTFADYGINENELLKRVKVIKGPADFSRSKVSRLDALEAIGGDANFSHLKNVKAKRLKLVGGNLKIEKSNNVKLPRLMSIGKSLTLHKQRNTGLGNLCWIGGSLFTYQAGSHSLPSLRDIVGNASFYCTKRLDSLQTIGGSANFEVSEIENLPNLRTIGGWAAFNQHQKSMPYLSIIGGEAKFTKAEKIDIRSLKSIGGNLTLIDCKLKPEDFAKINIKGDILVKNTISNSH